METVGRAAGENPSDRCVGRDIVLKFVAENTVIKDVDTLSMYDLACTRAQTNYAETIGLLRARLVKALPKDVIAAYICYGECIYNNDWFHAQEVMLFQPSFEGCLVANWLDFGVTGCELSR